MDLTFSEALSAATAISTAMTALFMYHQYRASAPYIRAEVISQEGDWVMVQLFVYPAQHAISLVKARAAGAPIAVVKTEYDESGYAYERPPTDGESTSVLVDVSLPPGRITVDPVFLHFWVKGGSDKALCISLHTKRMVWPMRYIVKINAKLSSA